MTQDEKYMKQAIKQAKKAYALDEVPIGCVIVASDKIQQNHCTWLQPQKYRQKSACSR